MTGKKAWLGRNSSPTGSVVVVEDDDEEGCHPQLSHHEVQPHQVPELHCPDQGSTSVTSVGLSLGVGS